MSAPLGSYADWQLAMPATPDAVLADLVQRSTGSEIAGIQRVLEGYSNEVYRVDCVDGQRVVIRVLRFDRDVSWSVSAAEASTIERVRAAGVPAPEILLHDTVRVEDAVFPVMVQRTAPGTPLDQVLDQLSDRERLAVLTDLGRYLSLINDLDADEERDWATAMRAGLDDRYAERDKIITAGFTVDEFDRTFGLLETYVRDFPCRRWVLCHGDLSGKHVFVDRDRTGEGVRVSGIIDFGDWKAGAPVHDLAVLRARDPRLDLDPILRGYRAPADLTWRQRLDLHTLMIALATVAFGVEENDQVCVTSSRALVRELVEAIRSR